MSPPKVLISGMIINHETIPPASIQDEISGPHIYPTPASAGRTSIPIPEPGIALTS